MSNVVSGLLITLSHRLMSYVVNWLFIILWLKLMSYVVSWLAIIPSHRLMRYKVNCYVIILSHKPMSYVVSWLVFVISHRLISYVVNWFVIILSPGTMSNILNCLAIILSQTFVFNKQYPWFLFWDIMWGKNQYNSTQQFCWHLDMCRTNCLFDFCQRLGFPFTLGDAHKLCLSEIVTMYLTLSLVTGCSVQLGSGVTQCYWNWYVKSLWPTDAIELAQHWFRWWLVALWLQAITWSSLDLPSVRFSDNKYVSYQ